jgi:hypothetical protein
VSIQLSLEQPELQYDSEKGCLQNEIAPTSGWDFVQGLILGQFSAARFN